MALTLDWNAIRPLNGDRSKGFEELCAQLARAERSEGASFERKGTPDAGVECSAILANGFGHGRANHVAGDMQHRDSLGAICGHNSLCWSVLAA